MKKKILLIVSVAVLAFSCSQKHVCPSYDSSKIQSPTDVMNNHKGKR